MAAAGRVMAAAGRVIAAAGRVMAAAGRVMAAAGRVMAAAGGLWLFLHLLMWQVASCLHCQIRTNYSAHTTCNTPPAPYHLH